MWTVRQMHAVLVLIAIAATCRLYIRANLISITVLYTLVFSEMREWPCSVLQCLPLLQCQAFRYLNDRGSFGCPAHSRHTSRKSLYWPVTCQHNFILQTCGLLFCKSKLYAGLSVTFFIAYFSQLPYYSWSWPHKIYWVQRENLRDCKGDIGGGADNMSCVLSHSLYWFSGLAWVCLMEMLPLQFQIKVYYL